MRLDLELQWRDLAVATWGDIDPDLTWATWTHRPLNVEIDGNLRWWANHTLRIDDTVDDHSDLAIDILDGSADWTTTFGTQSWGEIDPALTWDDLPDAVRPQRGMHIRILDQGDVAFAGWIDKVTTRQIGASDLLHSLRASDHSYLAEKRIIAAVWENITAGALARDVVDRILTDEGITYTAASIDDGPTVRRWAATYQQCAQVLDDLADQANFVWYIDHDRVLHFHARDRFEAPWTVTWPDLGANPRLSRGNDSYRNRQWMVGGKDTTAPLTERFPGDGERQTFNVAFPVRRQPTVTVNGASQTVGVRGIDDDSDKQWFFSHESTEISQNDTAAKLTSADLLEVVYEGVFEFVARQTDAVARDDRGEVEGGRTSGLVEKVTSGEFSSRSEAFEQGARKLDKYARSALTLEIDTLRAGLKAGQIADVDLPALQLHGDMLITRVSADHRNDGNLRYRATLVDGPHEASWRRLFRELAQPDTSQVLENISEDETVTLLKQFSKDWTWAENPNMLRRLTAGDGAKADGSYTATFRDRDRIRFVEWTDLAGTTVLGRRQLIDRQGLDTHEVTSTAYLSAAQGSDGGVGELRWYGGHRATLTQGSGVLVAVEVVNESKTEAEAWQVERVDRANDTWDDDRAAALGS